MTKKIILALALVASSLSYAQQNQAAPAVASEEVYGLLGQRYAQVGFGAVDVNHFSREVYSVGALVNSPITKNIDVSLAYANSFVEAASEVNGHALDLGATYYITEGQFKPFGTVTVGYVWPDLGDELTWSSSAGVEYVFSKQLSVQVAGSYEDNFKKHNEGSWSASITPNYWFNQSYGVSAGFSFIEGGDLGYVVAAGFRF